MTDLLTAALVLITAVYAWLTWKIAAESKKAAIASRDAARAAEAAAEAANRSAVVAEASLAVKFEVEPNRRLDGDVWFDITPSANVYIHALSVDCAVVPELERDEISRFTGQLRIPPISNKALPLFVHLDEVVSFEWPQPPLRKSDYGGFGFLSVEYSLAESSPHRSRGVFFETAKGLGVRFTSRLNLPSGVLGDEDSRPLDPELPGSR